MATSSISGVTKDLAREKIKKLILAYIHPPPKLILARKKPSAAQLHVGCFSKQIFNWYHDSSATYSKDVQLRIITLSDFLTKTYKEVFIAVL